ncbi:membrane protein [Escherichia coli]|nr:membrane protein [Escherichia coli]
MVVVMVVVMVVLMRFMDVVYSVIFICLCAMPILVKVFSDLSQ